MGSNRCKADFAAPCVSSRDGLAPADAAQAPTSETSEYWSPVVSHGSVLSLFASSSHSNIEAALPTVSRLARLGSAKTAHASRCFERLYTSGADHQPLKPRLQSRLRCPWQACAHPPAPGKNESRVTHQRKYSDVPQGAWNTSASEE